MFSAFATCLKQTRSPKCKTKRTSLFFFLFFRPSASPSNFRVIVGEQNVHQKEDTEESRKVESVSWPSRGDAFLKPNYNFSVCSSLLFSFLFFMPARQKASVMNLLKRRCNRSITGIIMFLTSSGSASCGTASAHICVPLQEIDDCASRHTLCVCACLYK